MVNQLFLDLTNRTQFNNLAINSGHCIWHFFQLRNNRYGCQNIRHDEVAAHIGDSSIPTSFFNKDEAMRQIRILDSSNSSATKLRSLIYKKPLRMECTIQGLRI